MSKHTLHFGILLMGFSFTVTQGLLLRELLVAFFGNELSIGLILGGWLILEALGSGLLGRLAERWSGKASSFAGLQALFAIFLPLTLYAAYVSRRLAGAIPGEGIGLVPIFGASFLILAPLALVDGAMFTFGCRAYASLTGRGAPSIGRVYVYEALGAIAGGIAFTYLFIPFLLCLQTVLLLASLNLVSAALILVASHPTPEKRWLRAAGLLAGLVPLAAGLGLSLSPWAEKIQRWANAQQWAGYHLVYSQDSPYGNVAVVHQLGQYTFYTDGVPVLTAPLPDVTLSEEIVHLPLLFVPEPRRALVLSGGVGGVLHELSKYPQMEIDYAELDPLLIEAVRRFPTPLTAGELNDPRVRVETVDGRLLVKKKTWELSSRPPAGYDSVIIHLPYPTTLELNRFYTAEFFALIRGLLSAEGVLVVGCPGSLAYMSDELRHLNALLFHTLRAAFPYVRPIPGEVTLWLASPAEHIIARPASALVEVWQGRNIETRLLTSRHLRLRMDQRYLDWFWESLGPPASLAKVGVNRDFHPRGLFYGLSYWNALFSPPMGRVLALAGRLNLWLLGLAVMACSLLALALVRFSVAGRSAVVPIVILTTGFTGMAADLVLIFTFQTLYGYIYHWIGLFIMAFMGGLSLGAAIMSRRLVGSESGVRALWKLELLLVLYWALLPIVLSALHAFSARPAAAPAIGGALLLLNAAAGSLVGAQFPLANSIWLKGRPVNRAAGVLYACDLAGAFVGSIVIAVFLVPILGIVECCLLTAMLKGGSLLLVTTLPARP